MDAGVPRDVFQMPESLGENRTAATPSPPRLAVWKKLYLSAHDFQNKTP